MNEGQTLNISHGARAFLVAAAVVIAAVAVYGWAHHWLRLPSSSADRSADIAADIGADSCSRTSYYIENRLDGSKTTIYECVVGGVQKCVTYEGGIARDATDTVRILWADTFGNKPGCAE